MVGIIEDVSTVVGNGFTQAGESIMLLEAQQNLKNSGLGGSEYLKQIHGLITGDAPYLDIEAEKRLQACIIAAIRGRIVNAAHDTAEGGLAVALAEMAINSRGTLGAHLDLKCDLSAGVLFGEVQSRIVVSVPDKNISELEALAASHNINITRIGTVVENVFSIQGCLDTTVSELRSIYETALPNLLQ